MLCQKCNSELPEESKFCNKCGFMVPEMGGELNIEQSSKQSEQQEELGQVQTDSGEIDEENPDGQGSNGSVKSKRSTRKIIGVVAIIVLIAVLAGIGIYRYQLNQEKELQLQTYKDNILTLEYMVLAEGAELEDMTNTYIEVWGDAIDSSYKDFNVELANQYSAFESKTQQRESKATEIEQLMKDLQNPPDEYKKAYDLALELYGNYKEFYNLAIDPEGSYLTYSQKVRDTKTEFMSSFDKLQVLIPQDSN